MRPLREILIRSSQANGTRAILDVNDFGFKNYLSAALPDRVYTGLDRAERPPSTITMESALDATLLPTPLDQLLADREAGQHEGWQTETRRTVGRLEAFWLLLEDKQRLLDVQVVDPLAHQASLIEHVLATPSLKRVLIADEVGLGKTVEAGLLIKRLKEADPNRAFKVLYLTEARLVENVAEEFERLGLSPRLWTSDVEQARLRPNDSDPLVIASMHRAVYSSARVNHFRTVAESGPWDMVIFDEAHHLTDWSEGGGDPQERMRLARVLIKERLTRDGRVILLSGTPHQGSTTRFVNLLRLLSEKDDEHDAAGRVIYRIKDDITDWEGKPLFPRRDVRPPTKIQVGSAYQAWLKDVHALLSQEGQSRAGTWRRAQALQWCASSPQAGLAYLIRLALRAGLTSRQFPALKEALVAVRPYRDGPPDEDPGSLEARIAVPRDEDDERSVELDSPALADVLRTGSSLIKNDAVSAKLTCLFDWLRAKPTEKFVIFAQPIETVFTLHARLEKELGAGSVALIVGGQDAAKRKENIRRFRQDGRVRCLVSSRSGGEGISLQVARHLIHFDVPWNPMELEQRVGRVHRYGSVDTIIVETLVFADSRESQVLEACRAKLARIVSDIDQSRIDVLFSRTMSLISTTELAEIMAGEDGGPFTTRDQVRLDELVQKGYALWSDADKRFRAEAMQLKSVNRGVVGSEDFQAFLGKAMEEGGESLVRDKDMRLGLNSPPIAKHLRDCIDSVDKAKGPHTWGGGLSLVSPDAWKNLLGKIALGQAYEKGALLLCYCSRVLAGSQLSEAAASLHAWLVAPADSTEHRLSADALAHVIRLVRERRSRRTTPSGLQALSLYEREEAHRRTLRQEAGPTKVAAVFPVAAIWIEPQ